MGIPRTASTASEGRLFGSRPTKKRIARSAKARHRPFSKTHDKTLRKDRDQAVVAHCCKPPAVVHFARCARRAPTLQEPIFSVRRSPPPIPSARGSLRRERSRPGSAQKRDLLDFITSASVQPRDVHARRHGCGSCCRSVTIPRREARLNEEPALRPYAGKFGPACSTKHRLRRRAHRGASRTRARDELALASSRDLVGGRVHPATMPIRRDIAPIAAVPLDEHLMVPSSIYRDVTRSVAALDAAGHRPAAACHRVSSAVHTIRHRGHPVWHR